MTYRGHIKNGQVVLDEPAVLNEGTAVDVVVSLQDASENDPETRSLQQTLLRFAGIIKESPPDLAENHDHYIHGAPKKS